MFKRLPLLIAVSALTVWLGNFIVKNFLASSLIAYDETAESRDLAVAYSPANPLVIAARGKFLLYRAEPARAEEAMAELQRAVRASPRDYRFWLELGRAYENTGEGARAEKAWLRAVELAPRYFETRWTLANFRLRAGKTEPALNDLREAITLSGRNAARPDEKATFNVYNAIAGALGVNLDALRRVAPPNNVARAYLTAFLATHDAPDAALDVWRQLALDDQASYRSAAFQLIRELQGKGRFADAREVWDGIERLAGVDGPAASTIPRTNLMVNAGFERLPISERFAEFADSQTGFDWIIGRHAEVRARRTDSERHSGAYSLHLTFAASMQSAFQHVSQIVAVEPAQSYRLSYFVKTRNVSTDPPLVEIAGAMNSASFALRSVVPSGTWDWMEQTVAFSIPETTNGLRLTIRCPQITALDRTRIAEVWFDDFKLEKTGQ
jgi:tetratricopeptide (TPR) repeat protein